MVSKHGDLRRGKVV